MRIGTLMVLAGVVFAGCSSVTQEVVPQELPHSLEQAYVDAWLSGDEEDVLDLFEPDAVIIPSGMDPKQGRAALETFWFPDDGSTTVITDYETTIDGWKVDGDLAWFWGHGTLSFNWTGADGQTMEANDRRSVYTAIARLAEDGRWRFVHRSWSNLR